MKQRLAPKPSSRNIDQMNLRLAIYANGWIPIPCEAKSRMLEGWNKMIVNEEVIRGWDKYGKGGSTLLGTGLRIEGKAFVLDLDIKDPVVINRVLDRIEEKYPIFFAHSLWRHSGGTSLALFAQVSEPVGGRHSVTYGRRLPDGTVVDKAHAETHGSKTSGKYFAGWGPHKEAPRVYGWDAERSPANTRLDSLPVFDAAEVGPLIDLIEAELAACGLEPITPRRDLVGLRTLYDLTPETEFVLADGSVVTCADLEAMLEAGAESGIRGVMTLEEWAASETKEHCKAYVRKGAKRLAISDFFHDVQHYYMDEEPRPEIDPVRVAELLSAATAAAGDDDKKPPLPPLVDRSGKRVPELKFDDLVGHSPDAKFIYRPTGELWSPATINSRLTKVIVGFDEDGKPIKIPPSVYIMRTCVVEHMSWVPGRGEFIEDVVMREGGIMREPGARVYNLYQAPPAIAGGDPAKARRWVDHVHRVYEPADAQHIIHYLGYAAQHPGDKINHALMLGGAPGIGKDTILGPVRLAVGEWNVIEVRPPELFERFNKWQRSVILRINEMHDLGDGNMYALYERLKVVTAAPPEMLRVNEKNRGEYHIPNVVKVIMTTNHKTNGIYLPADDRRTYVAWSPLKEGEGGDEAYFTGLHAWLAAEGDRHVAAYLLSLDLRAFNPKAPPVKTEAFWSIVNANRSLTDTGIAEVLAYAVDKEGASPVVLTLDDLRDMARTAGLYDVREWLSDPKHRRQIPSNLEKHGYIETPNQTAQDKLWRLDGRRQMVYRRSDVTYTDAQRAIEQRVPKKQGDSVVIVLPGRPKRGE